MFVDGTEYVDSVLPTATLDMNANPNPGDVMLLGAFDATPGGNTWHADGVCDDFVYRQTISP